MKALFTILGAAVLVLSSCSSPQRDTSRVVANPIDLDYQYGAKPQGTPFFMAGNNDERLKKALEEAASIVDSTSINPTIEQAVAYRQAQFLSMISGQDDRGSEANSITGERTAADPVAIYWKDKYWLFHSGANGYWMSDDMQHWTHLESNFPAGVAPTVMIYKDEMYYITSNINRIFKTSTPQDGMSWKETDTAMRPFKNNPDGTAHDPYIFPDEDGRVYFYWECDLAKPIKAVEYDPDNHFLPKADPIEVIRANYWEFGFEVPGNRNDEYLMGGYQEGSIMTKHDGRYYLQYATSGTEYDGYADGVYVADSPMGPFSPMRTSPMSIREGGFSTGAGHGDTFQDKYGNWWHLSTNIIGKRHILERRISLYPVVFTPKGNVYTLTEFGDYPFELPDRKVDFLKEDIHTGWMNLSLGKTVTASSELEHFEARKAADNSIKTWWAAASGNPGEWLSIDLEHPCTIRAIQLNFADHDGGYREDAHENYKYVIEASLDGRKWSVVKDCSMGENTRPHELLVLDKSVKARYVKVTNKGKVVGNFSIFDLRLFGSGDGSLPGKTTIKSAFRDNSNRRRIVLNWDKNPNADGYLLRWGVEKDELYTSMEVYDTCTVDLGCFISGEKYWFTLDTFNENGIVRGTEIIEVK